MVVFMRETALKPAHHRWGGPKDRGDHPYPTIPAKSGSNGFLGVAISEFGIATTLGASGVRTATTAGPIWTESLGDRRTQGTCPRHECQGVSRSPQVRLECRIKIL